MANTEFANKGNIKKFPTNQIPDEFEGLDIGPKTIKLFQKHIKKAETIVWNGPLGVFEFDKFANGTKKIAKAVGKTKAFSFIGGGDSAAAVIKMGYSKRVSHISTGGGASLTMLEGKTLPGVDIIDEKGQEKKKPAAKAEKAPAKKTCAKKATTAKAPAKKAATTKTTAAKKTTKKEAK
jgi:phosphoglycerate kinase